MFFQTNGDLQIFLKAIKSRHKWRNFELKKSSNIEVKAIDSQIIRCDLTDLLNRIGEKTAVSPVCGM